MAESLEKWLLWQPVTGNTNTHAHRHTQTPLQQSLTWSNTPFSSPFLYRCTITTKYLQTERYLLKKSDCRAYSRHVDRNTSLGECKGCPSLLNVLEGGKRGWAISLRRMYAVTADPSEDLCRHRCPRNVTNCCVNGGHSYCDWPAQYSCFLLCISAAVFKRNCERKITVASNIRNNNHTLNTSTRRQQQIPGWRFHVWTNNIQICLRKKNMTTTKCGDPGGKRPSTAFVSIMARTAYNTRPQPQGN